MKTLIKRVLDTSLVPIRAYLLEKVPARQMELPRPVYEIEREAVRQSVAMRTPDNPCLKGFKAFSQNDEDGILQEIFRRIAVAQPLNKTFIEIGCGNGLENNSHYLLLEGFKGCWVDGDAQNLEFIRAKLGALEFPRLRVQQCFIDLTNIGQLISSQVEFLGTREPDLFSLDIDGNDLWILLEALRHFEPKVICVEYNPKFPPPLAVTITYNPSHTWRHDDYHGASLQAFRDGLPAYRLVCCNLCGVNAFFVRKDLASGFADSECSDLYQPFREHLTTPVSGHCPSLKWLRDSLLSPRSGATVAHAVPAR